MSEDLNEYGKLVPKHLAEALKEENARLKAEVERLKHSIKYWQIEAETDHDRWMRALEENEALRKKGAES